MRMKQFHTALHHWYAAHGRHDLPWRSSGNPYHVYISEVMLQQTQVKTVLDRFYFPFLAAFPSLEALAGAPEDAVLKQWEGLGYYSRARNLHKAAKMLCPHPKSSASISTSPRGRGNSKLPLPLGEGWGEGTLPRSYDQLIALPGIGKNTAHAILAFGYRLPYPVLEANVKRVLHRIFALKERDEKQLWQRAEELLDRHNPFDYNQAMMDLGALVCLPKAPRCDACPAASICKGKNNPLAYPAPKAAKVTPVRRMQIMVLRDANGRYFVSPRQTRFLGGLYGFTEREAALANDALMFQGRSILPKQMVPIGAVQQVYSHFKLEASVQLVQLAEAMNTEEWVSLAEMKALALSKADQKIMQLLL